MTAKKDVAPQEVNALANVDFMADAGGGMEGTDKDSFAIPFLRVLQKISPQVDEADAAFVEGAKGGQFFNTVNQKCFDGKEGVIFIPCAFQRRFLRWAPRGSEQGFKGEYLPEDVAAMIDRGEARQVDGEGLFIVDENGEVNPKKCDKLMDTRSHFGLLYDEATGEVHQVVMPLSSTQIKKSKMIMSMLSAVKVRGPNGMVTPPTWVNKIRLTSVLESNDQGSWYGIKPEAAGFIESQDLYDLGKAFHAAITAGEAKANYAEAEGAKATTEGNKF